LEGKNSKKVRPPDLFRRPAARRYINMALHG
jgi:hypothetical protein